MISINILVLGGTRYFGKHLVSSLLLEGHQVTIATRGNTKDEHGDRISRIIVDRTDQAAMTKEFAGRYYDVIFDNIAYSSNDVKYLLDVVDCGKYVLTSSCSVYHELHPDMVEKEFDPMSYPLKWCSREDYPYDELKRQAECALFQIYHQVPSVAVRFPYVIGEDDHTKRLYFYVEHIIKGTPMYIDNMAEELCFIRSTEAGYFLSFCTQTNYTGPLNGCSYGSISLHEIIDYISETTGIMPIFADDGEAGPYNGTPAFHMNTELAKSQGYHLTELNCWIYLLLDRYIEKARQEVKSK